MLVLDGLDCLLLGTVFIVLFDLAGSLAHADLWFLFELISLVIVVGVIVADLRQCCVAGGDSSVELGLVLALTDLRVALDFRLAVFVSVCFSFTDLLLSLSRNNLLLNRHRLLRVDVLQLLA